MAFDALVDSTKLNSEMTATANAIRNLSQNNNKIIWEDNLGFSNAINSIDLYANIGTFSSNFQSTIFSWLFVLNTSFQDFIDTPFNSYGKISNATVATPCELEITNQIVHIKNNTQYVLSIDGTSSGMVLPTDIIQNNKEYKIYLKFT